MLFGASGALARRMVLPALYDLAGDGLLPERYAVVGYALDDWDDDAFRAAARAAVEAHARHRIDEQVWASFARRLFHVAGSLDDAGRFAALQGRLAELDSTFGTEGRRVHYLAVPSAALSAVASRLAADERRDRARIVIEQPFEHDLVSAQALNAAALQVLMLHAKAIGPRITLQRIDMDFAYRRSFTTPSAAAYERLLLDVMHGDHSLFPRYDEVVRAWKVVQPVLDHPAEVVAYPAGTWGPAAGALVDRGWHLR